MPPESDNYIYSGSHESDRAQLNPSTISSGHDKKIGAEEVQIDDQLYCAKSLSKIHPGGEVFVRAFAGSDATEAFLSYHRRRFPHASYKTYQLRSGNALKALSEDQDYLDLCKEVEKILPRHKSFAPWHYFVKIFVLMAVTVYFEYHIHSVGTYPALYCAFIGLLMALIGLNVQHDANHGAISRYGWINRLLGMTQNWIGGSAIDWIHQHVVQHHVNCNDVNHDPDILGSSVLRINPTKPLLNHQWFQHVYVFVLLALFGFSFIISSFVHLLVGQHLKYMSKLLWSHRVFDSCFWMFFHLRWTILPIYTTGSLEVLSRVSLMYVVGGFYLSFFFIISHNFVGAHIFDSDSGNHDTQSFLYKQASSSSNVGGEFLCFLNGGLNYQIEHHLFPRVQHSHYPRIAPYVKEYCKKKRIPYVHFPTIYENLSSCISHLYYMGNNIGESLKT